MPSDINPFYVAVWFCVGFFTAMGWVAGVWTMNHILALI